MIGNPAAPGVVRRYEIPDAIRRLSPMADADYLDLFTAPTPARATPHSTSPVQWLRATLYEAPLRVRVVVVAALLTQRAVLGMRRPWRIADSGSDWVRLEASSALLTGHVVLRREPEQVAMATFVHYERPAARRVWPPVSVVHRAVARFLVRHAARVA